jgi:hypothetical protein
VSRRNGRPIPIEAERALLGGALVTPDLLGDLEVHGADFGDPRHGIVWEAILRLWRGRKPVELASVAAALRDEGDLDAAGGAAYVAGLVDGMPRVRALDHWAEIVRRDAARRRLVDRVALLMAAVNGDSPEKIYAALREIEAEVNGRADLVLRDATPAPRAAADVLGELPAPAIIGGIAWAGRLTVLASESGAGKTFALLGLAASVADGVPWCGRETRRGSVLYVSYEGDALGLRLAALREAGLSLDGVYVLRASAPLSPLIGRDGAEMPSAGEEVLAAAIRALVARLREEDRPPIVLVVIDTVRASLAGSEDSSEHVAAYLRVVRRLMAETPEAAAIIAHHSGWQDSPETRRRRERGSSAFRGNADATLYLELADEAPDHGAYLVLRTLKVRDEERPAPLRLVRRRVALPLLDRRGQPLTSCVVEADGRSRGDVEAAATQAAAQEEERLALRVLDVIAQAAVRSNDDIRVRVGGARRGDVSTAVSRLVSEGRIARDGQRSPWRVVSRPQSSPVVPGDDSRESSPRPPLRAGTTRGTTRHTQSQESGDDSRGRLEAEGEGLGPPSTDLSGRPGTTSSEGN